MTQQNLEPKKWQKLRKNHQFNCEKLYTKKRSILPIAFLLIITIFTLKTEIIVNNTIIQENQTIIDDPINPKASVSETRLWNRTWGFTGDQSGKAIWGDGIFIYTVGLINLLEIGSPGITIIKFDMEGNQVWNRSNYELTGLRGMGIWGDSNGIYIVCNKYNATATNYDIAILKYDFNGDSVWTRIWEEPTGQEGHSIWGDGTHIYVVGTLFDINTLNFDLILAKWDTDGNFIWNQTWGGTGSELGNSISGNGTNIYTTGIIENSNTGQSDVLLVKWDSNGNVIWNRSWGGPLYDMASSVYADGLNVYIVGSTLSFGAINSDVLVAKWDLEGNFKWYGTWVSEQYYVGNSIWSDGAYVYTTGYGKVLRDSKNDQHIIKWDTNGTQIAMDLTEISNNDYGAGVWGYDDYVYTIGTGPREGVTNDKDLLLICWNAKALISNKISNGTASSTGTGGTNMSNPYTLGLTIGIIFLVSFTGISLISIAYRKITKKKKLTHDQGNPQRKKGNLEGIHDPPPPEKGGLEGIHRLIQEVHLKKIKKDFQSSYRLIDEAECIYDFLELGYKLNIRERIDFEKLRIDCQEAETLFKIVVEITKRFQELPRVSLSELGKKISIEEAKMIELIQYLIKNGDIKAEFNKETHGIDSLYVKEELADLIHRHEQWKKTGEYSASPK
jgi:hypothetical protein